LRLWTEGVSDASFSFEIESTKGVWGGGVTSIETLIIIIVIVIVIVIIIIVVVINNK
jgi:hypothetical protein